MNTLEVRLEQNRKDQQKLKEEENKYEKVGSLFGK